MAWIDLLRQLSNFNWDPVDVTTFLLLCAQRRLGQLAQFFFRIWYIHVHKPYENVSKLNELIHSLHFLNKIRTFVEFMDLFHQWKKNLGRTGIGFDLFLVLCPGWGERFKVRVQPSHLLGFYPDVQLDGKTQKNTHKSKPEGCSL